MLALALPAIGYLLFERMPIGGDPPAPRSAAGGVSESGAAEAATAIVEREPPAAAAPVVEPASAPLGTARRERGH